MSEKMGKRRNGKEWAEERGRESEKRLYYYRRFFTLSGYSTIPIPRSSAHAFFLILGLLAVALAFSSCGNDEEEPNIESAEYRYNEGEYDKAIAKYEAIEPKNVDVYVGLGWAYLKNNDLVDAKKNIDKAIEKQLSNLEANVALLGIYLASSSAGVNRFKLAIKAAETVLESAPDNYISQYDDQIDLKKIKLAMVQAYLYDGQIDKAVEQMSELGLSEKDLSDLDDLINEISVLSAVSLSN